jgi:hypothetical protein
MILDMNFSWLYCVHWDHPLTHCKQTNRTQMAEYRTVVYNNPNKNISVLLHTITVHCQTSLLLFFMEILILWKRKIPTVQTINKLEGQIRFSLQPIFYGKGCVIYFFPFDQDFSSDLGRGPVCRAPQGQCRAGRPG